VGISAWTVGKRAALGEGGTKGEGKVHSGNLEYNNICTFLFILYVSTYTHRSSIY